MSAEESPTDDDLHMLPEEDSPARQAKLLEQQERADQLIFKAAANAPVEREEKLQFSLLELFGLVTLCALGLGIVRWFPAGLTAGVLGIAMLLVLIATLVQAEHSLLARKLCIVLMLLYLSAAAGAIYSSLALN